MRPAAVTLLAATLEVIMMHAAAAPPAVQSIEPQGITQGASAEVILRGERMDGAVELLLHDPGLVVESVVGGDPKATTIRLSAAPDAPLGEHRVRLRTTGGLSDLFTLWVTQFPIVPESEPPAGSLDPQPVPPGTTVWGSITREDVDTFAIDARAGERISAEVAAMRLGRALFDPVLSIEDPAGFEIAVCDDAPLLGQDAFVSAVAATDGRHLVRIREASYGGDASCRYLLSLGAFPRPRAAWPPGTTPGAAIEASFPGEPSLPPVAVMAAAPGVARVHAVDRGHVAPSANLIAVSSLPVHAGEGVPAAPVAFHGRLTAPVLEWPVLLKGGQPIDVRVLARRLRTPVDPVVEVRDPKGAQVASNDDAVGGDAQLRFTPAADGEYRILTRDFRNRTGEDLVVRVEVDVPVPALRLGLERIDPRRPQYLQSMQVPRGGAFAMMLRAECIDASGPVALSMSDLPPGVEATIVPMGQDLSTTPIILRAAADAPLAGALCRVEGTVGSVQGALEHRVPLVLGPPNDALYYETTVDRLSVAVTEPAPFRIRIVPPAAPALRLSARPLVVQVERDAGMKDAIQVRMLWNPPGISSSPGVTIAPDATSVEFPLNVSAEAPLGSWQVGVLATAPEQGGERWVASELVEVQVQDLFMTGALQLAAAQQGQPGAVSCTLTHVRPFDGQATLRLVGLPPGVSASPVPVSPGQAEVVFPLVVGADAPAAQHKGLFVEVDVATPAQVLTHRFSGAGSLRIDKASVATPPAVAEAAPVPASTPAAPPTAPPKPLSRLEQLRQAQRAADGARSNAGASP
ncbi:MAG: hypothetical protein RLZZ246_1814 [Planctomycetota bacterium]